MRPLLDGPFEHIEPGDWSWFDVDAGSAQRTEEDGQMTWQPPPRGGRWVDKLAATGEAVGDDKRSIVSLGVDDLLVAASVTTGLEDFGDDWFRQSLDVLSDSLDQEAALHLPGRLRARAELQTLLRNRLALVDLWNREPSILDGRSAPPSS